MQPYLTTLASLLVAACGGGEPHSPPGVAPGVTPDHPVPTQESLSGAPEPMEPPSSEGPPPGNHITRARFAELAGDQSAFRDLFHGPLGVVHIETATDASDEDPRANPEGIVEVAERLCAGDGDRIDALRTKIASLIEYHQTFRCEALLCEHDAEGEYTFSGQYEFTRSDQGAIRLRSITLIEGGPVTEEFRAERAGWAEARHAELAERPPCPERSRRKLHRMCIIAPEE